VTDSRRIWARRAGWLAAAGIFLAANVGFFLWYRGTARERKAALEARKVALEREVDSREAEAKKLAADRRAKSLLQGYTGNSCSECQNFTMVRNGTCEKCDTCGATSGCS